MFADDVGNRSDRVEMMPGNPSNAAVTVFLNQMFANVLDLFFLEVPTKERRIDSACKRAFALCALIAQRAIVLFSLAYHVEKSDFIVRATVFVWARNILFLSHPHEKHLKLSSEEQVYKAYYSRSIRE